MPGIQGADKFAEKLRLFQGAADQFNLGQGAAEQFGLNKGAAEMFNLGQGAGSVFGAGMSNPENPLYSGVQQKVQQQAGVDNPFQFAGKKILNATKQGLSGLADFLFGGEDFGYMERSEDERDTANRKMLEKFLEDQRIKDQSNLGDRLIQNRPRDEMSLFGQRDR